MPRKVLVVGDPFPALARAALEEALRAGGDEVLRLDPETVPPPRPPEEVFEMKNAGLLLAAVAAGALAAPTPSYRPYDCRSNGPRCRGRAYTADDAAGKRNELERRREKNKAARKARKAQRRKR